MDLLGRTYHIMILVYNMEGTHERIKKEGRDIMKFILIIIYNFKF
jgi:hypothetical protein